jgi:hypothetical protein
MPTRKVPAGADYRLAGMGPDDVTADWLSTHLGYEIASISHERIGDGQVGLNLRVHLGGAPPEAPASVVLKLPSPDEKSRMTGIALRNYEREVKFYTELAPSVDIRAPHCHFGEWNQATGDFVLILEDMAASQQGDQVAGCTLEHAVAAVSELARLHGPTWDDPALDKVDWLTRRSGPDDTAQLVGLWQVLYPGFVETYRPYLSDETFELVAWFGGHLAEGVDHVDGPSTVTHGDYRLDNLLFGVSDADYKRLGCGRLWRGASHAVEEIRSPSCGYRV